MPAGRGEWPKAAAETLCERVAAVVSEGEGATRAFGPAAGNPPENGRFNQRCINRQTQAPRSPPWSTNNGPTRGIEPTGDHEEGDKCTHTSAD